MSHQYLAFVVMILAALLPKLGVVVPTDQLTTTVLTLVSVGAGLYGIYRRWKQGGIKLSGVRL